MPRQKKDVSGGRCYQSSPAVCKLKRASDGELEVIELRHKHLIDVRYRLPNMIHVPGRLHLMQGVIRTVRRHRLCLLDWFKARVTFRAGPSRT